MDIGKALLPRRKDLAYPRIRANSRISSVVDIGKVPQSRLRPRPLDNIRVLILPRVLNRIVPTTMQAIPAGASENENNVDVFRLFMKI